MNRVITAFLVCLLAIVFAGFVQPQTQPQVSEPRKRILLLHAYGDGVPVYQKTTPAFLAVMQAAGVSFDDLFFEYLDLQRNNDAEYRRNLAAFFRRKYADKKIDLIITLHRPALNFILNEGKDLFPGMPAVSYFTPDEIQISDTSRRFLVMPMRLDNRGTLDMALALFPETRLVVYISGLSEPEKRLEDEAKRAFTPCQDKLKFEYTSTLTVEEMLQRVASLPPGTIVIYNNVWTDRTGRTFIGREVADRVIKAANAPVFSLYDTLIGRGIVGGSLLSFEAEAKRAGKLALDILSGKLVLTEPMTTIGAPGTPMFDWRELMRWEVSEDRIPEGGIIVNRPPSLWQLYKQYIIGVAAFILVLLILIFVLLLQIHRRRKAEKALNEYAGQLNWMVKERTNELARTNVQLLNEITERKQTEAALKESKETIDAFFDAVHESMVLIDTKGTILLSNKVGAERLGKTVQELVGNCLYDYFPPDVAVFRKEQYNKVFAAGKQVYFEDARLGRFFEQRCFPVFDEEGKVSGVAIFAHDITLRKQGEALLRESEERYRDLYENAPNAYFSVGKNGIILRCNMQAEKLLGYKKEELTGRHVFDLYADTPNGKEKALKVFERFRKSDTSINEELQMKNADGNILWIRLTVNIVKDEHGQITESRSMVSDITEQKRLEELLHTMSLTDELTGLYNRRGFITLSEQQLKIAERTKKDILLFFADLDKMKQINDTLGHQEGDKALIDISTILKEVFRESDIIGRIGGDEFAILAIDTTGETQDVLTMRLYNTLDTYNRPKGRSYQLSLSIGIAHYNPETPSTLDELMAQADILMYEEKRNKQH